ncbi:MAG: hypothetical protein QW046_05325, partial [Candidatus Micrarchaeaceae archaeon]
MNRMVVREMSEKEQSKSGGKAMVDDEVNDLVQHLINLKAKTMSVAEQIEYDANEHVVYGEDVPQSISDVMKTTVKVVMNTYKEALKNADELAKAYEASDFKNVLLNAIEIYAKIDIVYFIGKYLVEDYVFRYARHGFLAEKEKKLEKVKDVVISLLKEKLHHSLGQSEYRDLLNDIIDGIEKFYDLWEPGDDAFDDMGRDLKSLRDQIEDEDNEDIDKPKYAILSDVMDFVQDAYGAAVIDGIHANFSVDDRNIGTSDVCDAYDDTMLERLSIYCDNERNNAYKAD